SLQGGVVASGPITDSDLDTCQVGGPTDGGITANHDGSRHDRVSRAPHPPDALHHRLIHRPVTSTADVRRLVAFRATALLVHLVGARAHVAQNPRCRIDFLGTVLALRIAHEAIAQSFFPEISLLVSDPIMQPTMWADNELGHRASPRV